MTAEQREKLNEADGVLNLSHIKDEIKRRQLGMRRFGIRKNQNLF
jgi:hypothetical protein